MKKTRCQKCAHWEYDEEDKVWYCGIKGKAVPADQQNKKCVNHKKRVPRAFNQKTSLYD